MIQRIFQRIGDFGCYFLSLLYIGAHQCGRDISELNILNLYEKALSRGAIRDDLYVIDPIVVINLAGGSICYAKHSQSPVGMYNVGVYKNGSHEHFVVVDKESHVVFDPLGDSETVAHGRIVSYRSFDA